jgi:hypothetical protein
MDHAARFYMIIFAVLAASLAVDAYCQTFVTKACDR